MREQLVDQGSQLDALASDFVYISQDGRQLNKRVNFQLESLQTSPHQKFRNYIRQPKDQADSHQIGDVIHTSPRRRHEVWQNIFHQEHENNQQKN